MYVREEASFIDKTEYVKRFELKIKIKLRRTRKSLNVLYLNVDNIQYINIYKYIIYIHYLLFFDV